ncbi:MAG: T9SS type A sorting domain-containing protein [Ignavibacteriales bacterium]|nr:T9SS type A sorting domain-containing protein [Ignavibacteriales bacterium]
MKKFFFLYLLLFTTISIGQILDTLWTRTYGGLNQEVGVCIEELEDRSIIMCGKTNSYGAGAYDIYVIKSNMQGDTLWTKTFGGVNDESANKILYTQDKGFIIIGSSSSFGFGLSDILLLKLDSLGRTEWYKTFGDSLNQFASDIAPTLDGGYIISGNRDGDYALNEGWLIKIDSIGNLHWDYIFEAICGSEQYLQSVIEISDTSYLVSGTNLIPMYPFGRLSRYFLSKFDKYGAIVFTKEYTHNGLDLNRCLIITKDSCIILAGTSFLSPAGRSNAWLIKVDQVGNVIWDTILDGSQEYVNFASIDENYNSDFFVTLNSAIGSTSIKDIQLLKLDYFGNIISESLFGGNEIDEANHLMIARDSSILILGRTNFFGAGNYDFWLLKIKEQPATNIRMNYPNGGENLLAQDTLEISWNSINVNKIKLEISIDSGKTWSLLVDSLFNYGSYNWVITNQFLGDSCLLKITNFEDSDIFDVSDSTFKIQNINDTEEIKNKHFYYSLSQNYPNPFNPSTIISYQLPKACNVTLKVFDVLGREVATLVDEYRNAGSYDVEFSIENLELSTAIYFYQLKAGEFVETKKMLLLK